MRRDIVVMLLLRRLLGSCRRRLCLRDSIDRRVNVDEARLAVLVPVRLISLLDRHDWIVFVCRGHLIADSNLGIATFELVFLIVSNLSQADILEVLAITFVD